LTWEQLMVRPEHKNLAGKHLVAGLK
jgi:hypothetical protein